MEDKNGDREDMQPCFQETWWSTKKRLCGKLRGRWALKLKKHPLKDERLELVQKGKGGRGRDAWDKREGRIIVPPICREFYNFLQCFAFSISYGADRNDITIYLRLREIKGLYQEKRIRI